MVSTSTVAEIGFLLGDPARVNMMIALLDGRAWTARELALAGGVTPQTASSHLQKLLAAGLIRVDRQGRHRYHRIASEEVAGLLEQMHIAGAALMGKKLETIHPRDAAMRELRSCYDHLAGRIAVELCSSLVIEREAGAQLKEGAKSQLHQIGIDIGALASTRRPLFRPCLDWSERRPHIAGTVGAALLIRFHELGWVRARSTGRSLVLTATGERGLCDVFGVAAVRTAA
jgi:DNA-binding transcriptional ArsR family regulator